MTWRTGYRTGRILADCKCKHPQITHYTKQGNCVYSGCKCDKFKPSGRKEFKNKRAVCRQNHSHDSGLEIKTCADFQYLKAAGEIQDFKSHVVVDLLGPSKSVVATYETDFIVFHNDGSIEYIECKGDHLMKLQPWPLKWALLQDKHKGDPKYRFRVVRG